MIVTNAANLQSLADMNDADIKMRLIGSSGSSIRLDFARGVAHHSVTLSRQALGGNHCSNEQDLAPQPPSMPASIHQQAHKSSQQTCKRLEQGYKSGDQEYQDTKPASHSSEHQRLQQQPLELMPPPSPTVVNLQASYDSSQASAGPQSQGVSPNVSPPPPDVKPVGKPILAHSPPPLSIPRVPVRTMPPARTTPATSATDGLDLIGETVRDDDTVKKQLVDIARRLKDELETQAHEVPSSLDACAL